MHQLHKKTQSSQIVQTLTFDGLLYQLELIRCGKERCKCTRGQLHGPYWYSYKKKEGRLICKYVGKNLLEPQHKGKRDFQRSRVYRAQNVLWQSGKRFHSREEVQDYVDRVSRSRLWRSFEAAPSRIEVRTARGASSASLHHKPVIRISHWHRCERTVLHELAHQATGPHGKHGPLFCTHYLDLVGHFLGADARYMLEESFRTQRVRF